MCVQSVIRGFSSVISVNIFASEQKVSTSLSEYFCFEWLSLAWKFASLCSESLQFLSTNISQGSVATYLMCGGIFNYCFAGNLLLSLSVKEIG